jgi:hypothetical protein
MVTRSNSTRVAFSLLLPATVNVLNNINNTLGCIIINIVFIYVEAQGINVWKPLILVSDNRLDGTGSIPGRGKVFFLLPLCPDQL